MPYKDPTKARAYQKAYQKTYNPAWYIKNKQKKKQYNQEHYQANREVLLPQKKAYNAEHREEKLAYGHIYHTKPSSQAKARLRKIKQREKQQQETPDEREVRLAKQRAYARAYYARDPGKALARQARRRAQKYDNGLGDFDDIKQWEELQEAFDHRCAYCGTRRKGHLTRDHITALTKHGPHTLHNIVPACHECNLKKNTRAPLAPVQPLLLTLAPARKKKGPKPQCD